MNKQRPSPRSAARSAFTTTNITGITTNKDISRTDDTHVAKFDNHRKIGEMLRHYEISNRMLMIQEKNYRVYHLLFFFFLTIIALSVIMYFSYRSFGYQITKTVTVISLVFILVFNLVIGYFLFSDMFYS